MVGAVAVEFRTKCDCGGHLTERPAQGTGNWGDWHCRRCGKGYCQDCNGELDDNDECVQYLVEIGVLEA